MAPVAVSGPIGLPITLPVAVQITPSGTQFTGGAELAVTLPAGSDPARFQPYVFDEANQAVSLSLAAINGQTIRFVIYHLTTPGLSPEAVPPQVHLGVLSGAQQLEAEIAQILVEVRALQAAGTASAAARATALLAQVDGKLEDYFQQTLKPLLSQAALNGSHGVCRLAIGEALRFERFVQQVGSQRVTRDSILALLPPVFRRGVLSAGQESVAADDANLLSDIADFYLATAHRLGLDTQENSLDAATIKAGVPLTVVLEVTAPALLADGASASVRVKPGYQLGNNPVKFSPSFSAVNLSLVGAESPDLPLQGVLDSGEAIFQQVTLGANTSAVTGTATAVYPHLVFGAAGPIEGSKTFTIEGALDLQLGSHGGSPANLTATVKKGTAQVSGATVTFEVLTGSGSFNPVEGETNAQGLASSLFTPLSATPRVRATVSSDGQNASSELVVDGQETHYPTGTYQGVLPSIGWSDDGALVTLVITGYTFNSATGTFFVSSLTIEPFDFQNNPSGVPVTVNNGVATWVPASNASGGLLTFGPPGANSISGQLISLEQGESGNVLHTYNFTLNRVP